MLRAAAFVVAFLVVPSAAADSGASHWQTLTRMDVDAVYRSLADNHPGNLPELGDNQFRDTLEAAHRTAIGHTDHVRDSAGYAATLKAFANAMGDRHITVTLRLQDGPMRWAGLVAAYRGNGWYVGAAEQGSDLAKYKGWSIVGCDGRTPDEVARQRLIYFGEISSPAALRRQAGFLLFQSDNPFVPSLRQCTVAQGGQTADVTLDWRTFPSDLSRIGKLAKGAPGLGIKTVGDGYWISLETLDLPAERVADDAWEKREALRQAPYVVVDLRGNGGGNSAYAAVVVSAIFGDGAGNPIRNKSIGCGARYRISAANMASFEQRARALRSAGEDVEAADQDRRTLRMRQAAAAGKTMSDVLCEDDVAPAAVAAAQGKVFVVTDATCFSSCLLTVARLRDLGAIQIGEPTEAHSRYMESESLALPSGLGRFRYVVGMAADPRFPLGPFVPAVVMAGDIADNAAVEAWFLKDIAPEYGKARK